MLKTLPRHALTGTRFDEQVGTFRCDLVGLRGETPVLAIEIRVTHKVHDAKAEGLACLGMPFIELDAQRLIESAHDWTDPLRAGFYKRRPACPECRQQADRAAIAFQEMDVAEQVSALELVAGRHADWRWQELTCPRCKGNTLEFELETAVDPLWVPQTVRLVSPPNRAGFYASHCHRCSAVVGPFRGVEIEAVSRRLRVFSTPDRQQGPLPSTESMQRWVRRAWAAWDGAGHPPSFGMVSLPALAGKPEDVARATKIREEVARNDPWAHDLRTADEALYWIRYHGDVLRRL